jgi:ABC-type nitrate/sulfonate/bicarbonate transport system substrate-binding protein
VKLYGNVIIASPKLIRENPAAVKAFLLAFTKGAKEVMANPDASVEYIKQRDGIINTDLEKRRLRMAIDSVIASPTPAPKASARSTRPPVADGLAGVRRLRHQDPRQRRPGVERELPADQGGTEHPAAAKK